ncbi:MAG: SDR family oxidoreductase [Chitinophagaceae bacterium]|nr:MAG: SDR family oxidoreductase [Chitinophagaceae bacterium]
MPQNNNISNKTIVITGASSGVGKAMALELARTGARLVLSARRREALDELAAECEHLGALALVVPADMNSAQGIRLLAENAAAFGGTIDVWINNAGVLAFGPLEDIPASVNEQVIKTNLIGYITAAHTVLPYFKQQGHGILINNISVGGWFPTPYGAAYSASKFGLRGFSDALKGELKGWPEIHVCDLFPAFLDTPGLQHAANYTGRELKPIPPLYPPRKVARAVVKLISRPRAATKIGFTSGLIHAASALFPGVSRSALVFIIRRYLKRARVTAHTDGNVITPVRYGTSAEGGWKKSNPKPLLKKVAALGLATAAGLLLGYFLPKAGADTQYE